MTATLQPESKSSSRRALLAGALGGIGAWAASAIGRPSIAQAHDADDVRLGGSNTATTPTSIANLSNNNDVLEATSSSGVAVYGDSDSNIGVRGTSGSNYGVYGQSSTGSGVFGTSNSSVGVYATSAATNEPASLGASLGNSTGVLCSSGFVGTAKAKTGVYGVANPDASA
jgi:hypothetical protein